MAVERYLQVDPVACDAFGHCAELLPELIWLDEWGYPVLDEHPIGPALMDLARQAVRACPRNALTIRRRVKVSIAEKPPAPRPRALPGRRR